MPEQASNWGVDDTAINRAMWKGIEATVIGMGTKDAIIVIENAESIIRGALPVIVPAILEAAAEHLRRTWDEDNEEPINSEYFDVDFDDRAREDALTSRTMAESASYQLTMSPWATGGE